jgi:hypothetical protein
MTKKRVATAKTENSIPPDSVLVCDHSITIKPPDARVAISFKKQLAPFCYTTEQEVTLDEAQRLCALEGRGVRLISKNQLPIVEAQTVGDPKQLAEEIIGWHDETLDAGVWWQRKSINPRDAAMLLCGLNPHDKDPDKDTVIFTDDRTKINSERKAADFDRITHDDFQRLLLTFEDELHNGIAKADVAQPRTLSQWRNLASNSKLKYHPWIDKYEQSMQYLSVDESESGSAGTVRGIGKQDILAAEWPLLPHKKFSRESLERALSDVPKWMQPAREGLGARGRGKGSAMWNPALIAALLVTRGYAHPSALSRTISAYFPAWKDEWRRTQEISRD